MTLLSVDGTNTLHRAYHAIRPMSFKGFPTNAIVGYVNILRANIRETGATHVLNSFDRPGKNFRHEIHANYKGDRPKDEEKSKSLKKQLPVLVELLDAMGFAVFGKKGVEADDVIGSTAALYEGGLAYILSGDKDFAQELVNKHVRLINPNKGIIVSRKNCKEVYSVEAKRMIDFLMLDGDKIDCIPGVPGVGLVTAVQLIEEFGKAEKIPLERFPKKARETVNIPKLLKLNRQLVTIRHDLYDANAELDMSISKVNVKAFTRICEKYGLDQIKRSVLKK
jgi:DNA polymerase-1